MASIELRTYVLKTTEAAKQFLQLLKPVTITSLPRYKVSTYGVFASQSHPERVILIVRYNEGTPDGKLNGYAGSDDFKRDFESLDKSTVDRIEHETLEEADWAKLK